MTTTTTTTNLRESRKAQSAAKRAAAQKAAPKPAEKAAVTKLRWQIDGKVEAKGKPQSATAGDREYKITGTGDSWKAVVKVGGKTAVLSEGSFGKAYNAVVRHNKAAQA